ncbi:MAG: acyltransferase family protein [Limnobacter sp.]|nr:acyltransferase family protein [Limnobacter sp.]
MKHFQSDTIDIKDVDVFDIDLQSAYRIPTSHSRYFDMWRGGSALVVAFGHMIQIFAPAFPVATRSLAAALAGAAVMAFFVISGFFIHKSIAQYGQDGVNWRKFVRARVNRIYPPFALSIIITVSLYYLAPTFFASGSTSFLNPTDRTEFSLSGLWITILHLNNFLGPALSANGPLWSLTYEIWYYTIALLVVLAVSGKRVGWTALPIVVVLSILDKWFFILGLLWVAGFMLSVLHSKNKLPKLPNSIFIFVLPASLFVLIPLMPSLYAGKLAMGFQLAFGIWMINHINNTLHKSTPSYIWLLVYSSKFSYTLYVLHFPLLLFSYGVLENTDGVASVSAWGSLGLTIAISALIGWKLETIKLITK